MGAGLPGGAPEAPVGVVRGQAGRAAVDDGSSGAVPVLVLVELGSRVQNVPLHRRAPGRIQRLELGDDAGVVRALPDEEVDALDALDGVVLGQGLDVLALGRQQVGAELLVLGELPAGGIGEAGPEVLAEGPREGGIGGAAPEQVVDPPTQPLVVVGGQLPEDLPAQLHHRRPGQREDDRGAGADQQLGPVDLALGPVDGGVERVAGAPEQHAGGDQGPGRDLTEPAGPEAEEPGDEADRGRHHPDGDQDAAHHPQGVGDEPEHLGMVGDEPLEVGQPVGPPAPQVLPLARQPALAGRRRGAAAVVSWPSKSPSSRSTRGWSWSFRAARSWEKVCSASARTPAMRPWAPSSASANPSRARAT